eukprot:TRINITY_DN138_c2_g1_i1.p1 TRINITY_DN138_c2_g1~~TRINITY_DN138_c2_g1_i1.p1  ORF type:complete len:665 (-),score=132.22 TRINITY_DN138_c2_g1_i1:19-2013(-)
MRRGPFEEQQRARQTDPFFYPTTMSPLGRSRDDLGTYSPPHPAPWAAGASRACGSWERTTSDRLAAAAASATLGDAAADTEAELDRSGFLRRCNGGESKVFVASPMSSFIHDPEENQRLQNQNDSLSRQVQALEHAKSLAAAQSAQQLRTIRLRQEQMRRQARMARQRAQEVQAERTRAPEGDLNSAAAAAAAAVAACLPTTAAGSGDSPTRTRRHESGDSPTRTRPSPAPSPAPPPPPLPPPAIAPPSVPAGSAASSPAASPEAAVRRRGLAAGAAEGGFEDRGVEHLLSGSAGGLAIPHTVPAAATTPVVTPAVAASAAAPPLAAPLPPSGAADGLGATVAMSSVSLPARRELPEKPQWNREAWQPQIAGNSTPSALPQPLPPMSTANPFAGPLPAASALLHAPALPFSAEDDPTVMASRILAAHNSPGVIDRHASGDYGSHVHYAGDQPYVDAMGNPLGSTVGPELPNIKDELPPTVAQAVQSRFQEMDVWSIGAAGAGSRVGATSASPSPGARRSGRAASAATSHSAAASGSPSARERGSPGHASGLHHQARQSTGSGDGLNGPAVSHHGSAVGAAAAAAAAQASGDPLGSTLGGGVAAGCAAFWSSFRASPREEQLGQARRLQGGPRRFRSGSGGRRRSGCFAAAAPAAVARGASSGGG